MSIIDKAEEEEVSSATPKVFDVLFKIKYLLITIPVICVVIGLAIQAVTTERNVGMIKFEMGSFATPAHPKPVPLAETAQVKARIRQNSWNIRDHYPQSLIITTLIENDVVTVTGTAEGPEITKQYLAALVQMEIDFQNDRLKKMEKAQLERVVVLRENLEKFKRQRGCQGGPNNSD